MVTRHVLAPPDRAFAYLADPIKLGRWSLGCFDTFLDTSTGAHSGHSLFDGAQGWFRIEADPVHGLIDYWVGPPEKLSHRISARVIDAGSVGYETENSLVMLTAWRPAGMPNERWERLCASHEAEIWLIKEQIETEHQER